MAAGAELPIGSELLGYRIEGMLGRGGMGIVYLAEDSRLKRKVALKLVAPELSGDRRFRERFLAETELAAALDHPNVVPVYDAGDVEGRLYLAMRYVEGSDLKTLLTAEELLVPARALSICEQAAAALDAAHARGLVHRDVKPSNVLLDGNEHVYLADFGLSRRLADPGAPIGEGPSSLGTPAYAAPEQIGGAEADGRADVYSLGCVLYECLTGEPPYSRDSELALLWAHVQEPPPKATDREADLPTGIDAVIATALAKDRDDRYQSCHELVEAARAALAAPAPVALRARRRRRLALALGVAVAAAGALAAGLLTTVGAGGAGAGILIGISADKTPLSPVPAGALPTPVPVVDLPAGQAFLMRIDQINRAGGVLGKKIRVAWLDDKSDPRATTLNAQRLISRGADVIVTACNSVMNFPSSALTPTDEVVMQTASVQHVLALSLCAESPETATPASVGAFGGSMSAGADTEGASMAEWLRKHRPQWKRALVLTDKVKANSAAYFLPRWAELGGDFSGQSSFDSLNSGFFSLKRIRLLRAKAADADVIYVGTNNYFAIQLIRDAGIKLPIATTLAGNASINQSGLRFSNVYTLAPVCVPGDCSGAVTPQVRRFVDQFEKRYGTPVANPYAVYGYDLATAVVEAIRRARSTDSTKIARALFSGFTIQTLAGPVRFSERCHRPQPPSWIVEQYTNGKAKALGRAYTHSIPLTGDGSTCTGPQTR